MTRTREVNSIIELGPNIGNNLRVLNRIFPGLELAGVEINATAAAKLEEWGKARVFHGSIIDFVPEQQYDLAFVSGVLIHINPKMLPRVYDLLYQTARRYVCLIEYYNPSPVEVPYRGHRDKLFKRDFAGEMMEKFEDLKLLDYGFVYHRDANFPLDDVSWFLLEKI
jgi:spore coat polysaccharide biosynthesis protein SpsF